MGLVAGDERRVLGMAKVQLAQAAGAEGEAEGGVNEGNWRRKWEVKTQARSQFDGSKCEVGFFL